MYKANKLFLIVITGPAGAGKSTLADLVRDEISFTAHIGVDHIKRFISEFREVKSHDGVSRKVINAMAEQYLTNNINVVVEQGMSREEVEALKDVAEKFGADFYLYKLEAHYQTLKERADARSVKLNKPLMSEDQIKESVKKYELNDHQSVATFDSGVLSTREMADLILNKLDITKAE